MVKSVLGKLIQREFGKERYACYADKLKRKQSMDVFCDIYEKLSHSSEEELDLALKGLLDTKRCWFKWCRTSDSFTLK